jgi:alpha/beta superfamily hydrolase
MIIKNIILILLTIFLTFSCNQQERKTINNKTYITEDVVFYNKTDNIKIHGTLTFPKSGGPFLSAILVPGSGRTNRNGTEDNNLKPLYEIADFLTKNGMAVLRCDKRGVGDSEGTLDLNTTIDDLVSDIVSSIDYLSQRPEIDKIKIGLIGHSYGGIIAAKASLERPKIMFLVMLGSPGVKNGEILFQQIRDISRSFGINDTTIDKFQYIIKNTSEILNSNESLDIKRLQIELMYRDKVLTISEAEKSTLKHFGYDFSPDAYSYSKIVDVPYFYEFYTFNPQTVLEKVKCPILSIIGEKDLQVNPKINQQAIENALIAGRNRNYSIQIPKGYNHLFQKTKTGNPAEYERHKVTISPEILNNIFTWISSLPKSMTKAN